MTQSVQDVPNTYAGGWVGKGLFRNRPHDAVVIGLANANWSRDIPDGPIWESALELGYQFMLGSNVSIQPGVQYIFNPMGKGDVDDPLVLGLPMSFSF
ncbi:carbohydrate porin [Prochlorococcus sp. MIT 1201]|uniref:carbohydrate porin n=1 Tax=Prochlorococcus sp. MIT 1201 TaxID=3082535 RepID=UPI0039A66209